MAEKSFCLKLPGKHSAKTVLKTLLRLPVKQTANPFGFVAACLMLLFVSVVPACRPGQPQWEPPGKLPEGVLDREAMIALLVDVHLAEGDLLERNLPAEEQEALLLAHYRPLLARHGISAKQLTASYAYYVERPLTLNAMYEEVIEALNRIQVKVQAEVQDEIRAEQRRDTTAAR